MGYRDRAIALLSLTLAGSPFACDRRLEGERTVEINERMEEVSEALPGWRWQWTDYDENRNDAIERPEWDVGIRKQFRRFDADRDQELDEEELQRGMFAWWDGDPDRYVTPTEFDPAFVRSLGFEDELGDFAAWDRNQDRRIDEGEFGRAWAQEGVWNRWNADRDAALTEQEFARGWFDQWDTNRSGTLERDEWGWAADGGV